MRASFSESITKKIEQNSIFKKSMVRVFSLCLSIGIIFSSFSYNFFYIIFNHYHNFKFLSFFCFIVIAFLMGGACCFLVFSNILSHIKKIIQELCQAEPRWEWLEKEYMESDIHSAYVAIKKLHLTVSKQSELSCLTEIATQVAHDIRSPITSLDFLTQDITNLPEEKRITIRKLIKQINDIASNLLDQYKEKNNLLETIDNNKELVAEILLDLITEKRYQYPDTKFDFNIHISPSSYNNFANISRSGFKSVVSNLIDNSIDAFTGMGDGQLTITLNSVNDKILLLIEDNGIGMPESMLEKIRMGESITLKKDGHGLGLINAIKMVEEKWGGQFLINSNPNLGTKVEITLPKVSMPKWYTFQLAIFENTKVFILDDDEYIHNIWDKQFEKFHKNVQIFHFCDIELMLSYCKEISKENTVFLIDYELIGSNKNGLDIINELNISQQSYLVTNRYDDKLVQDKCLFQGIKIIPKKLAAYIAIEKKEVKESVIFIEDNEAIIDTWILHGEIVGVKVHAFCNINSFKLDMMKYDKAIPIYIDSDLKDGQKGEEFAEQLFKQGFVNLYLSTGFDSDHFQGIPWLKGVVGKQPPF